MSPLQRLREIKQRASTLSSRAFPPETAEEARRYATEAYRCCVAWYGPPKDPQTPYRVELTPGNSMHMSYLGKHYLMISEQAASPAHLCDDIAHEMYHRVSTGRGGLAREMWVQEILACLTSYWFCHHQGYKVYAEEERKARLGTHGKADVRLLRQSKRDCRRWLLHGGDVYADEFVRSLMQVGFALACVTDKIYVCRLSQAETLEEWIASLPQEDQYAVSRILELPCGDKTLPACEKHWTRLYLGLRTKGDYEAMVADFECISRLRSESDKAMHYLGRAYQGAKQPGPAIQAYQKAIELGSNDKWIPYNIGNVYWREKDYSFAAEWFQKAAEQNPAWAPPRYFLGYSLKKLGHIGKARQVWEYVLTLPDENYAEWARKALEDIPLSDTGTAPVN